MLNTEGYVKDENFRQVVRTLRRNYFGILRNPFTGRGRKVAMTALMLAFELFGGQSLTLYAVCCGGAYMLSGYYGLYSEQKIVYSKYKTNYINKKTH